MLTIESMNQYYGQSHILWDLNAEIPEGSCTCLMGRNGVGKTTFLKCVMGLLPARTGRVLFDGVDLLPFAAEKRAAVGIGYVPQGRDVFPLMSVEENLRVGLLANPKKPKQLPDLIFELFPVLKTMLHRRGGDLSGGQQQQLAIGRALALEPRLLILDEPTEGIQPNIVQEIADVIVKLNRELGLTVLLVEQKLEFARHASSHFQILERGRLVAGGAMTELNNDLVKQYLTV
ncbi:MAG: urea ABC transporter ATP-binding subunit UrtE [Pseudomonadota bacterium]|nr:urea ABC transporter ATP-binding subunit UrtE [Pseudomonadota bacterium]